MVSEFNLEETLTLFNGFKWHLYKQHNSANRSKVKWPKILMHNMCHIQKAMTGKYIWREKKSGFALFWAETLTAVYVH